MNFKQYLAEQTAFDYDEFEDNMENDGDWIEDLESPDDAFAVYTDEDEEDLVFEESDDFKPHMMYDPKTGKAYKAKKPEDHERMKKLGYVHEKPESCGESCPKCEKDIDDCECDIISERLIKKKVIRNGKKQIKWKSDRPGYKVVRDGNRVKEVKMSPTEVRMRKKQQKKGARKRKRTSRQAAMKRKRSLKRRTF